MSSRYDNILSTHREKLAQPWREFALRTEAAHESKVQSWKAAAYGYKAAADIVARECCNETPFRDILFPPLFFLYRHFVELSLKAILFDFLEREIISSEQIKRDHKILPKWKDVKEMSQSLHIFDKSDEFVQSVENSIELISSVDNDSAYSRYPENNNDAKLHSIHIRIDEAVKAIDDIDTVFYVVNVWLGEN